MKKNYVLIVGGIIPLLFSIFVLNYYLKDDRRELFDSAKLLDANSNFNVGQLVKFSGILSDKNPNVKDEYVLAVKEKFTKGQKGKHSEWIVEQAYMQPLQVKIGNTTEIEVFVASDYSPCGDKVKVVDIEPKKTRIVGMPSNVSVSAVGQILQINPIQIQSGHSLCTGTIKEYEDYLSRKGIGYLLVLLCIGVPSLGLIYLGVTNRKS